MSRPSKKRLNLDIKQMNFIKKKLGITKIEDVDVATMKLLKEKIKNLQNTRMKKKTKFKLWDIVICVYPVLILKNKRAKAHSLNLFPIWSNLGLYHFTTFFRSPIDFRFLFD